MKKLRIIFIVSAVALIASGCILKKDSNGTTRSDSDNIVATFGNPESNTSIILPDSTSNQTNEQTMTDESAPKENQMITLKTNNGDIKIELFLKKMPITAGNFLKLAKSDFYDGVTFHRVISNFMIQGGDPLSKDDNPDNEGQGGPGYFIEDEFSTEFSNVRGAVSMANAGPGTGGSQFFINTVDNVFLDFDKEPLTSKHSVFGRVVEGMAVVDAIGASETSGPPNNRPIEDVIIQNVVVE